MYKKAGGASDKDKIKDKVNDALKFNVNKNAVIRKSKQISFAEMNQLKF
jgi:hypothetical protein